MLWEMLLTKKHEVSFCWTLLVSWSLLSLSLLTSWMSIRFSHFVGGCQQFTNFHFRLQRFANNHVTKTDCCWEHPLGTILCGWITAIHLPLCEIGRNSPVHHWLENDAMLWRRYHHNFSRIYLTLLVNVKTSCWQQKHWQTMDSGSTKRTISG